MCHGQLISASIHKARKAKRCTLCRREIKPGERYQRKFIKDGSESFFSMSCEECATGSEALSELFEDQDDFCYVDDVNDALRSEASAHGWRKALAAIRKAKARLFPPSPPEEGSGR